MKQDVAAFMKSNGDTVFYTGSFGDELLLHGANLLKPFCPGPKANGRRWDLDETYKILLEPRREGHCG